MDRIAFFLNGSNIQEKDLSELLTKSYRLGGSEFEFLVVSYLIEQRDNNINSYFLSNYDGKVPHQEFHKVKDLDQACNFCLLNSIGRIVVDIKQFDEIIIKKYSKKLEFYIWAHNIVGEYILNKCLTLSCIKKIICVSQSQMLGFKDHPSILKACYIYNIILFKEKDFYRSRINSRDQHNVVYMGCIRPDKGFHVLAKAWPFIILNVPDAQLYVIGNGQLYGNNVALGKYRIATQEYEEVFMPYLTDKEGKVLPSVHFLGLLGDEKYDIMGKCKVGVPNPTNSTETFCISGVEMELMGCSVTTLRLPVYEETQMNNHYLFDNEEQIADYIIHRLKDVPDNFEDLYNFVTNKFAIEKIISKWEQLIKTGDVENMNKPERVKRSIKLLGAKYFFLLFSRTYNFFSYRIKHHILRKA